jgi:GT2 family glycosyltransferase
MTDAPDAAVVLVNYRTPELVARCLDAVERTRGALVLERVVVDNGAESLEALTALPVRVIPENENRGFAAGVNTGINATDADPIVLLNPDTEVHPGAIEALLAHLEAHPGTGVAAPLLVHVDGTPQANAYRRFPGLGTLFVELCIPGSARTRHRSGAGPSTGRDQGRLRFDKDRTRPCMSLSRRLPPAGLMGG